MIFSSYIFPGTKARHLIEKGSEEFNMVRFSAHASEGEWISHLANYESVENKLVMHYPHMALEEENELTLVRKNKVYMTY